MWGVVNTQLDRIRGKSDTVRSKSILGGGEPPQESSVFSAKLHRLDMIDTLNLQRRADPRSLKLSNAAVVDIDLNGIRCTPRRTAGTIRSSAL